MTMPLAVTNALSMARLEEHRSAIESGYDIPTLVIQDHRQRVRVHGRCPFCGSSGMFSSNVPGINPDNPQRVKGEVVCGLCARTVCHLLIGAPRPRPDLTAAPRGRPPKIKREGQPSNATGDGEAE